MGEINKKKLYKYNVVANILLLIVFSIITLVMALSFNDMNDSDDAFEKIRMQYNIVKAGKSIYYLYLLTFVINVVGIVYSLQKKQKLFSRIFILTMIYILFNVIFIIASYNLMSIVSIVMNAIETNDYMSLTSLISYQFDDIETKIVIAIATLAINLLVSLFYVNILKKHLNVSSPTKTTKPKVVNKEILVNDNSKKIAKETTDVSLKAISKMFSGIKSVLSRIVNYFKTHKIVSIISSIILVAVTSFGIYFTFIKTTEVNIIDDLKISYDGISGYAQATVNDENVKPSNDAKINDFISNLTYELSTSSDIKNGDVINLTIVPNIEKMKEYKIKIPILTKDFKVENLDEYIKELKDIKNLDKLDSSVSTKLVAINTSNSEYKTNKINYSATPYQKCYYKYTNDDASYKNFIVLIYEVNYKMKDFEDKIETNKRYVPIEFYDVSANKDGISTLDTESITSTYEYETIKEIKDSYSDYESLKCE